MSPIPTPSRASIPRPDVPNPVAAVPSPPVSVPRGTPRAVLDALRPSRRDVDVALGVTALLVGIGVVATAAYAAADAVLPLALLAGFGRRIAAGAAPGER